MYTKRSILILGFMISGYAVCAQPQKDTLDFDDLVVTFDMKFYPAGYQMPDVKTILGDGYVLKTHTIYPNRANRFMIFPFKKCLEPKIIMEHNQACAFLKDGNIGFVESAWFGVNAQLYLKSAQLLADQRRSALVNALETVPDAEVEGLFKPYIS